LGIPLNQELILLSYGTGVLIDTDHILFFPRKSVKSFRKAMKTLDQPELRGKEILHTPAQEPFTAIVLYSLFGFSIPLISFTIHILLDKLMKYENRLLWPFSNRKYIGIIPSGTVLEGILGSITAVITGLLVVKNILRI
jgi:hypothetical protein